jgi:hypothetical protein
MVVLVAVQAVAKRLVKTLELVLQDKATMVVLVRV